MAKQDIKLVPTVTTYSTQASVLVVEGSQLVRVPIGLLGTTGGVVPPDLSSLVTQVNTLETSLTSKVGTNDTRLTDTRVPRGSAGGALAGVYPNPTLASTGVLPGNYQNPTLTISADGRVTSASSGTSGGTIDAYTKAETDDLLEPLLDDIDNHSQRLDILEPLVAANTTTNSIIAADLGNKVNTWDSRLGDTRVPSGVASGDLDGSYPNPVLKDISTPGTYQYATVTIDTKGRVISAQSNSLPSGQTWVYSTTAPVDKASWAQLDDIGQVEEYWKWDSILNRWVSKIYYQSLVMSNSDITWRTRNAIYIYDITYDVFPLGNVTALYFGDLLKNVSLQPYTGNKGIFSYNALISESPYIQWLDGGNQRLCYSALNVKHRRILS